MKIDKNKCLVSLDEDKSQPEIEKEDLINCYKHDSYILVQKILEDKENMNALLKNYYSKILLRNTELKMELDYVIEKYIRKLYNEKNQISQTTLKGSKNLFIEFEGEMTSLFIKAIDFYSSYNYDLFKETYDEFVLRLEVFIRDNYDNKLVMDNIVNKKIIPMKESLEDCLVNFYEDE